MASINSAGSVAKCSRASHVRADIVALNLRADSGISELNPPARISADDVAFHRVRSADAIVTSPANDRRLDIDAIAAIAQINCARRFGADVVPGYDIQSRSVARQSGCRAQNGNAMARIAADDVPSTGSRSADGIVVGPEFQLDADGVGDGSGACVVGSYEITDHRVVVPGSSPHDAVARVVFGDKNSSFGVSGDDVAGGRSGTADGIVVGTVEENNSSRAVR